MIMGEVLPDDREDVDAMEESTARECRDAEPPSSRVRSVCLMFLLRISKASSSWSCKGWLQGDCMVKWLLQDQIKADSAPALCRSVGADVFFVSDSEFSRSERLGISERGKKPGPSHDCWVAASSSERLFMTIPKANAAQPCWSHVFMTAEIRMTDDGYSMVSYLKRIAS